MTTYRLTAALVLLLLALPAQPFDLPDEDEGPVEVDLPGPVDKLVDKLLGWLGLGGGGIPVSDAGTHANTGSIAISSAGTLAEVRKVLDETRKAYELSRRMAEMIRGGPQPGNWLPMLIAMAEDLYGLNRDWLDLANGGNGNYGRSVYPRADISALLNRLPLPAQLRHKILYAHGELADGLIQEALRTIGGIRSNVPSRDMIIWNLVGQHFSPDPSMHGTQQSLDRLGIASTTGLQATADLQKIAAASLQLQALEMQQRRNEEAIAMELLVDAAVNGPAITAAALGGAFQQRAAFRY